MFELALGTNKIQERVAVWVLLHYVKETRANELNSRMRAGNHLSMIAACMHKEEPVPRKVLRSYPEMVNYMLNKYAADPAIPKKDAIILR